MLNIRYAADGDTGGLRLSTPEALQDWRERLTALLANERAEIIN